MIAVTFITVPAELRSNHYGQAFDLGTGLMSGLSGKKWRLWRIQIHYQDPLSGSGCAKVWLHSIPNHFTVVLEKSKNSSNIKTAAFQSMSFLSAGCMLAGPFIWGEGRAGFSLSSFSNPAVLWVFSGFGARHERGRECFHWVLRAYLLSCDDTFVLVEWESWCQNAYQWCEIWGKWLHGSAWFQLVQRAY